MVAGSFALLAGIVPAAICEWVELPNTLGRVMHVEAASGGRNIDTPSPEKALTPSRGAKEVSLAVRRKSLT